MAADKPQGSAEEIWSSLGEIIEKYRVFHNRILVGIYMRGNVITAPGGTKFYVPDNTAAEDRWQGRVGLVLKKGPLAFKSDARNDFAGQDVQVGEWVAYKVSDGESLDINGVHCRLIEDIHIKLGVETPELIW